MKKFHRFFACAGLGILAGSLQLIGQETGGRDFAESIAQAHGFDTWPEGKVLKAQVDVKFGDKYSPLSGNLYMSRDFARNHYEQDDGAVEAWYKDGEAWISPADAQFEGAHFMLPTVAYFIGAPFKLGDSGVNVDVFEETLPMNDQTYPAAKITFGENVGDAPDDWYIVYQNPGSNILEGMAYIVTYSKSPEEAAKTPKMIVYGEYVTVGETEVKLSKDWKFFHWTKEDGPHGDAVFHVTIAQFDFVEPEPGLFDAPDDAKNVTPEHMQ